MEAVPQAYLRAARRWGPLADAQARHYGLPNGATLLLKIAYVESRFTTNLADESSAGARGPTQFMPSTRREYIRQYGVDPWASIDQAMHATALFMAHSGLASYNPGAGQVYINQVLRAPVSVRSRPTSGRAGIPPPTAGEPGPANTGLTGDVMQAGLGGLLILAGGGLVAFGALRMLGASRTATTAAAAKGEGK